VAAELEPLFQELRALMLRAAPGMVVARDGPAELLLLAPWPNPLKPKEPMYFGQVANKSYVAFHLMPLYMNKALQAQVSPALLKRKQGKTCFNFRKADPALFAELEALTAEGARRFAAAPTGLDGS
jgi:hypothetical protein